MSLELGPLGEVDGGVVGTEFEESSDHKGTRGRDPVS